MNIENLLKRAIKLDNLTIDEGLFLYENVPLIDLCDVANKIRKIHHPNNIVTWQIDRNVNITNVCISGCKFCNFHCRVADKEIAFITTLKEYSSKIEEMLIKNGDQLLLQGGLHPQLNIEYYEQLFRELKIKYPNVKLHALGAPEVFHIARISKIDTIETLKRLISAGLDSLPGAGAEILDSKVRKDISPMKCSAEDWLRIMAEAWDLGLTTSATMVYGHIETPRHRIEHLVKLRELQSQRSIDQNGFMAFIAWPMCSGGTEISKHPKFKGELPLIEYLRIVAISRIMLTNIVNIQASYLTVGVEMAQIALHSGANDLGSIMIEENVVSSTGIKNMIDEPMMKKVISDAGFIPKLRDQLYRFR